MARAKKGGEYGANGEFYKGGQFLNTIEENDKKEGSRPRKARKVQVAPYVWEVIEEGTFAIFQIVGTFAGYIDRYNADQGIEPFAPGIAAYGEEFKGWAIDELCDRYNSGERILSAK